MRRSLGLTLATWLIIATAQPTAAIQRAERLIFDAKGGETPALNLIERRDDGLTLELTLPGLDLDELTADGERFQALSIPGGAMRGAAGTPGLPTWSRLLALPAGARASVRILSMKETSLAGYRLFPNQPEGAAAFTIDRAGYDGTASASEPEVLLGEPARIRHQDVLPLVFSPVGYDPASGELRVAHRVELEIQFDVGDRGRSEAPASLPESFDRMFQDVILGYERAAETEVGPGSYLMIHPDVASVLSTLQPLIEWRERQGYNVVVVSDAATGTSASDIKSYIQTAYDSYDPPLEHVCLVGDANGSYMINCWEENISGYGGEGDHYYTMLDGGDVLSDIHLGRLSISSIGDLATIVDKIVTYETDPPTDDAGWFTRAGLAGDPNTESGITTVYVNQWLKSHLLVHGYTQIDTLWTPSSISMRNTINQGLSAFGYRGWLGMSGMSTGAISSLGNGYKLPFAVVVTCGTGSFKSETNCRSEAFLRAPNGGGVGSIGTATTGTHTRYNNCYYHGVWDGAVNGSDHRLGVAHTRGKLELFGNYQISEPNTVEVWSVWNNLMGDPVTDMWMAYPATLTVNHPVSLAVGANAVALSVTSGGSPVAGARVALFKAGEIRSVGYTDANGDALLAIANYSAGDLSVTALMHNALPYRGSLSLGAAAIFASYAGSIIDDDLAGGSFGNGDQVINGAETIELPVALLNLGGTTAGGVTATLSSNDAFVTIIDGSESFGDIGPGATVWSAEDFDFSVAAETPDLHVLKFDLIASSGIQNWTSLIELTVQSADLAQEAYTWSGGGGSLDPGESGNLSVTLRNGGSIMAAGTTATLTSASPWITVTDGSGSFGDIGIGGAGENAGDPFVISIRPDCFRGHLAAFTLTADFGGAARDLVEFTLPVGVASSDDPLGPDAHGYYALDNTDTDYPLAPIYSWVEIDPNHGGGGTDVGLGDFGSEQDDTRILDLPFPFQYYGEIYDKISICSNGWVAMGSTSLLHYRNWAITNSGSPPAMIAPFWDNLFQSGSGRVYHWHDAAGHRYVVQWSRVGNEFDDSTENFEVILHDPAHVPTSTGDGIIDFQYATINNVDTVNGYATVGIQNADRDDGLLYTYWNAYPAAAAPLSAGRAIRFMPATALISGTLSGSVGNASNGGSPIGGALIRVQELGQSLVSQAGGEYAGSVQTGTWTVRAEHESFEPFVVSGVSIGEDEVTLLNFDLIDNLGPYIQDTIVPPNTDDPSGPYLIETSITDWSELGARNLHYSINGGEPLWMPLTEVDVGSGLHRAELPGYPLNTRIDFWIEAEDIAGNVGREPAGDDLYTFYIVPKVLVIDDDMESNLGWTIGGPYDDATGGIWTRVDPIGVWEGQTEVQPENDASADGTICFITGNAEDGQQGTDDVDGGKTTLTSPGFDLSNFVGARLSYRRWFTNDTGNNPGQDEWAVQVSDDGASWVDIERSNASDRSWALQSFELSNYIEMTSTVSIRFIASDYSPGSLVEAGVDEFRLSGFLNPDLTALPVDSTPVSLVLLPNLPNPFNPRTTLRFGLPTSGPVTLRIYDASGRLVNTVLDGEIYSAGFHALAWRGIDQSGRPVSSGVYFAHIHAGEFARSDKMVLLK